MKRICPLPTCIIVFLCFTILVVPGYSGETHILRKGETLYSVSKKYNVPLDVIIDYNNINNVHTITSGTEITIPSIYKVKKGDTLYSIAAKNDIDLEKLLKANGLSDTAVINVGQRLYIPASESGSSVQNGQTGERKSSYTVNSSAEPKSEEENENQPVASRKDDKNAYPAKDSSGTLMWPIAGKRRPLKGKMKGISITGEKGATVKSVSSGSVIWRGPYRGFGKVVFVESAEGFIYVYGGNDAIHVSLGETVTPGSNIGTLGNSPHHDTPLAYFLVYKHGKPVDPSAAPRK